MQVNELLLIRGGH